MKRCLGILALFSCCSAFGQAETDTVADDENNEQSRPAVAPDLRDDDTNLKLQKGDFVIIPVPFSNPTLDTGLAVGAAYFHPQTEAEKEHQPASLTAAAGMYSSNESSAYGVGHQHYWNEDRWRFSGAVAAFDLDLRIFADGGNSAEQEGSWLLDGSVVYAHVSRMTWKDWYVGLMARFVDIDQDITFDAVPPGFSESDTSKASGLGVTVEFDRRDMPFNSYSGNQFKAQALFNSTKLGGDENYQSYSLAYSSYHELFESFVLAWQVEACNRSGDVELWDSCRIELRGFSTTAYMGKGSAFGQAEARWHVSKRWGFVGFAGAGYITNSLSEEREREMIPSYGAGIRFMVLPAKRINLRLDYARSTNSSAYHFSVGEAF